MRFIPRFLLAGIASLTFTVPAAAHPHIWVSVKSEFVYAPDGSATAIRHAWTFDDMYSAMALEGLEGASKGVFTKEELAPLAEVNITSIKESDFFTYAKADGKDVDFGDATDYSLEYKNETLTLYFTLPFKSAVNVKNLGLEVYDPSYMVDFAFAEKDGIRLVGAPAQCKISVERPKDLTATQGRTLSEAVFSSGNWGANFATRIAVKCP